MPKPPAPRVPRVVVVAGPNGAGKSTCAPELLRDELRVRTYVNADEIARGLAAFDLEGAAVTAGRVLLAQVRRLLRLRRDFAVESTPLAGVTPGGCVRRASRASMSTSCFSRWPHPTSPSAGSPRGWKRVGTTSHPR